MLSIAAIFRITRDARVTLAAKEKLILELQASSSTGMTAAQAEALNLAHTQLTVALEAERKKSFELANSVEEAKANTRELKLKLESTGEILNVLKNVSETLVPVNSRR